jgi:Protein of unknown function (DUF935)
VGLFGNLFSGIASAGRGLFGGAPTPAVPGEVLPRDPATLFRGEIETSRPRELFDGAGKPIPPAALTSDGLGHVYTFQSLWNAANKSYSWRWDEAYKRSQRDAVAMRRDCFLQGLLEERILPTSQMGWHVEPDNKKDRAQMQEAEYLTSCVQAMPNFERMTYCLLNEGVWAGRSGAMLQWDWMDVRGERSFIPGQFNPVNGDKLQFTWDGIPEIMIYSSISDQLEKEGCEIRITDRWRVAVFSRPEWRDRLIVYKHIIIDADFFESEMHGGIMGVGCRNFIYWSNFIRLEVSSYLLDFMQRVGSGFNVYYYDPSNPQAQAEAVTIAKTQGRNTWIVWPRSPGDKGATKGVERIEPGTGNADVLRTMNEYFDDKIERYIVGQTMSGGSDNESGLGGSGRAQFARQTKQNLIRGDCNRVEEAYTRDLIRPLQKYNRPQSKFRHRFKFDIDTEDPKEKLAAIKSAWEMGVTFDMDEVRELTGCAKPAADAELLKNPQMEQAAQGQGQPGQQPPPPNSDGGALFQGQPKQGMFEGKPAASAPANGNGNGPHQLFGKPEVEKREGPPQRYEKDAEGHEHAPAGSGHEYAETVAGMLGFDFAKLDEGSPMRYAATDADRTIQLAAYHGDNAAPTLTPLGTPDEVRAFLAWCRTQDQAEDVQQFSIDSSTNPVGSKEDVERFAAQLGEALSRVANEGIGPEVRQIGDAILVVSAGAEGLVLTEESPAVRKPDDRREHYGKMDASGHEHDEKGLFTGNGDNSSSAANDWDGGWGDVGGADEFPEPAASLSDEDLDKASKREVAPFPSHEGIDHKKIEKAWGIASRLWPEMTGKITRIGEYDPSTVPQGIEPPNAFIDPATGVLAVKPGAELDPETLWHELVHLDQQSRGILKPRNEMDPDAYNNVEAEAVQRAKAAKGTLDKMGEKLKSSGGHEST